MELPGGSPVVSKGFPTGFPQGTRGIPWDGPWEFPPDPVHVLYSVNIYVGKGHVSMAPLASRYPLTLTMAAGAGRK